MAALTAGEIIDRLELAPLAGEGGWYRRIHPDDRFAGTEVPGSASRVPPISVIYYLVTPESFSALHWLAGSEVWTWIAGDGLEQVVIRPDRSVEVRRLGLGPKASPVALVPPRCWQGARLIPETLHEYALCSTVMSPAYDESDFRLADRSVLEGYGEMTGLLERFLA